MRTISQQTIRALLVLTVGLAAGLGCGNDNRETSPFQGVSGRDAEQLNAGRSRFDTDKDPPFTADTHFAAGQLAESQNATAAALLQYQQALKLNPKHQGAHYRTAVIYTQAKQYEHAIESWKAYVHATGGASTGYSNLAFCYELAGKPAEAESAYKFGILREPANSPCRVNYGLMLARNGRTPEAIQQLAVVLSPAEVHYNLASVYEQLGRKDDAREEYQKALELDPKLWEAQSRLSKLE